MYCGSSFFFWLGCFGALGNRLVGCLCPWGFPGLLPLFLGGFLELRCGMVCHVALRLVVDCSGSVGGKSGGAFRGTCAFVGLSFMILRLSQLVGGCCVHLCSPCNHLD